MLEPELARKAKRAIGTFLLLLGAGLILDARAVWLGVPLALLGAALFGWGVVELRPRTTEHAGIEQPTESRP